MLAGPTRLGLAGGPFADLVGWPWLAGPCCGCQAGPMAWLAGPVWLSLAGFPWLAGLAACLGLPSPSRLVLAKVSCSAGSWQLEAAWHGLAVLACLTGLALAGCPLLAELV